MLGRSAKNNMFTPKQSSPEEIRKEFAKEFQQCLAKCDHEAFSKLVDANNSGIDASALLNDKAEVRFKNIEEIQDYHGEVLSQTDDSFSIYFYVEFEGEYREAIVEFDLHKKDEGYEIVFQVFKPS